MRVLIIDVRNMVKQLQLMEQKTNESRQLKKDIEYFKKQFSVHGGDETTKEYLEEVSLALAKNQVDEIIMKKVEYLKDKLGTKETTSVIASSQESIRYDKDKEVSAETAVRVIKKPERRAQPFIPNSFKSKDSQTSVNLSYQEEENQNARPEMESLSTESSPPLLTTVPVQSIPDGTSISLDSRNTSTNLLNDKDSNKCSIINTMEYFLSCSSKYLVCEETDYVTHLLCAFDLLILLVSFVLLFQTRT